MDFILDNPEIEKTFKQILRSIPAMQNGITADSMKERGMMYEKNWGVSIVDLKQYACGFSTSHLLALKLWNKKWRETMLLATMLDEPKEVSEEQMDFWIKTAENIEVVEQAVMNLFCKTPFAFVKAMEWCCGKKFNVKVAGLLMMGRLALTDKKAIDEMFESFFEVLQPLAKDKTLHDVFYRTFCQLARRSKNIFEHCVSFAEELILMPELAAQQLGIELKTELETDFYKQLFHN